MSLINNPKSFFLPPLFRFLMELTAWSYMLLLAFSNLIYLIPLLGSVLALALFNFHGDKKHDGPINIPGWLRILNEWISGGLLSLVGAFLLFQELGLILQLILFLTTAILDRKRYSWMLGFSDIAPDYVTQLRQI